MRIQRQAVRSSQQAHCGASGGVTGQLSRFDRHCISNRDIGQFRISVRRPRINTYVLYNRYRNAISALTAISRSTRFFTPALAGVLMTSAVFVSQSAAQSPAQKPPAANQQSAPRQSASGSLPKECFSAADGSEQISMLLETVKEHPTSGAYNTLGALYAAGGRVKCAIPALKISLRLDARNWEAHYNLALALLHTGDATRAADELRAAIREKPDSATSHFALGTLLHSQRKLAPAATEFGTVLKIDPDFPGATVNLAQVMMEQGNSGAAIALLEKAVAQSASSSRSGSQEQGPTQDGQKPGQEEDQTVPLTVALGLTYAQTGQPARAAD